MQSIKFPKFLAKNLDRAITRLENGESIEHIIASSPSSLRMHLAEFLPIVAELRNLPTNSAPQATRRYSFLNHTAEKVSRFARFMRTLRTGYALTGAFVLLLIVGVSTAAANSLPGSPLFSLKKTWENAQIKVVARNPSDRAQLELTLANQRLAEAQEIFSNQSSDESDKQQAVIELNSQTQVALNQIQQVASTPSITSNPGIIKNLETLTKTQASLQAQVDPSVVASNTTVNQQTLAAIKETVTSATNTQSSAQIAAPQQAEQNGKITAIDDSSFTVDKNVFEISSTTKFFSANGLQLKESSFNIGDTILVIGTTSGEKNQAQIITLEEKAVVQPTTTDDISNTDLSAPSTDAQPTPASVTGGFILESPTPQ